MEEKLKEIKERFNEDEIERDDMEWLIEQVELLERIKSELGITIRKGGKLF